MDNLLIVIPLIAIMLWLCCWLIKKIPEHLLAEYLADQAEIATYQLPPVEKYHLYTALITCSTLFILIISYVQPSSNIKLALLLIFSWSTVLMATIDWRARLLTDNTVYPLLWLGLIANTMNIFCSPTQAIYGAIFCYLIFWSFNKLYFLITKKNTIGNGDMKMAAALGAWFGIQQASALLLIIFLIGLPVGLIFMYFIKKNPKMEKTVPFGIPLALGSWIYYALYQLN